MSSLPTNYQQFIHTSRYARWRDDLSRRETWPETVGRYFDFFETHLKDSHGFAMNRLRDELEEAVLSLQIMPSMRALMTAGPALERCNVAGYNCCFLPIDSPRAFDEALYILMCGTGVGFSVERQVVAQLPVVSERFEDTDTVIVVKDSKEGWASAYRELINLLYAGQVPKFDVSRLRPAGARLKTFGGRSSGPDPLVDLFNFTITKFRNSCGRRLNSLECHDIVCKIADVVVVGGVRRSALISLSNLSDDRMRHAKSGQWWEQNPQRALANNSAAYTEKPEVGQFMAEWLSLYDSKSGERGIFNREGAKAHIAATGRRDTEWDFGTNPCGEILLRPNQFCNLTEVIVRPDDCFDAVANKIRMATILGTFQATLTNFKYIRKRWRENTEEERLLGVSLTGIYDSPALSTLAEEGLKEDLVEFKKVAIETNKIMAEKLGIPTSTAVTCVKPSGTVSQLVDSASGIHARHSPYYIRTVRGDNKDPLTQFLIAAGVPNEPCVLKPDATTIFSFPVKSADSSKFRNDLSAIDQLELWKVYKEYWCEHNPSVTITVKEAEWPKVGAWVWDNMKDVCGVSFLPYADHVYKQAPYQECTKERYEEVLQAMPEIDWAKLAEYEKEDNTVASQELACTAGICDI